LEQLIKQILASAPTTTCSLLTPSATAEFKRALTPIRKIGGRIQLASFSPSDLTVLDVSLRSKALEDSKVAYIILDLSPSPSSGREIVERDAIHDAASSSKTILHIQASPRTKTKSDAHFLQHILPAAIPFIKDHLLKEKLNTVCVFEGSGNGPGTQLDISVGLVLVAIQFFFDQNGKMVGDGLKVHGESHNCVTDMFTMILAFLVDKQTIRKRLEWIIESEPRANPSRATLKRVNEFLLTPPAYLAHSKS
jgi:tRNA A64-2'-O-ribosylphosphate transferase